MRDKLLSPVKEAIPLPPLNYEFIYETIGYRFNNPALLVQALTRKSALSEKKVNPAIGTFENFEFLGDRVLNLVIADILTQKNPHATPGELHTLYVSFTKNSDASKATGGPLYRAAKHLKLDQFIILGNQEKLESRGRKPKRTKEGKLSDHMEALIGAIYIDSGRNLEVSREFIERYWMFLGLNDEKLSLSGFGVSENGSALLSEKEQQKKNNLLIEAAQKGDFQRVEIALRGGAQVNAADKEGYTPLHYFVDLGDREAVFELLNEYRAPIDPETKIGLTPILLAVYCDHLEVVELLLEEGALLSFAPEEGKLGIGALSLAARGGAIKVIKFLMKEYHQQITSGQILEAMVLAKKRLKMEVLSFLGAEYTDRIDFAEKQQELKIEREREAARKQQAANEAMFASFTFKIPEPVMLEIIQESTGVLGDILLNSEALRNYQATALAELDDHFSKRNVKYYKKKQKIEQLFLLDLVEIDPDRLKKSLEMGADPRTFHKNGYSIFHLFRFSPFSKQILQPLLPYFTNLEGIQLSHLPSDMLLPYQTEPNLKGISLNNAVLRGINFKRTFDTLSNISFDNAQLIDCNFERIEFKECSFHQTSIENVNFDNISMDRATFISWFESMKLSSQGPASANIHLRNVDLRKLNLSGLDLRQCNLYHSLIDVETLSSLLPFLRAYQNKSPKPLLSEVDLRGSDLSQLNLKNISLAGAYLDRITFESLLLKLRQGGCTLKGIRLRAQDDKLHSTYHEKDAVIDLSGLNLSSLNLSGIDFGQANLKGADLRGSHFEGADLSKANLKGALIEGASFKGTYFGHKTFKTLMTPSQGSLLSFQDIIVSKSYGIGISLEVVILNYLNLSRLNLERVKFNDTHLSFINFTGTKLKGTDFTDASLEHIDASNANFEGAIFKPRNIKDSSFRRANFRNAELNEEAFFGLMNQIDDDIDLRDIEIKISRYHFVPFPLRKRLSLDYPINKHDLDGAKFSGSTFHDDTFVLLWPWIKRKSFTLQGVTLKGIDLSGKDLSDISLTGAHLRKVDLINANLQNMDLTGMKWHHVAAKGANLKGAKIEDSDFCFHSFCSLLPSLREAKIPIKNVTLGNILPSQEIGHIPPPQENRTLPKLDLTSLTIENLSFSEGTIIPDGSFKALLPWIKQGKVSLNGTNVLGVQETSIKGLSPSHFNYTKIYLNLFEVLAPSLKYVSSAPLCGITIVPKHCNQPIAFDFTAIKNIEKVQFEEGAVLRAVSFNSLLPLVKEGKVSLKGVNLSELPVSCFNKNLSGVDLTDCILSDEVKGFFLAQDPAKLLKGEYQLTDRRENSPGFYQSKSMSRS